MDTEVVVHRNNGILLSSKKECIWVAWNEVDGHRSVIRVGVESERQKQISYSDIYIYIYGN